jgi:hypothetical protein
MLLSAAQNNSQCHAQLLKDNDQWPTQIANNLNQELNHQAH